MITCTWPLKLHVIFLFFTVIILCLSVCNCFSGRSRSPRSFWQQRRRGLWGSSRTSRSTRSTGDQRRNWRCRNPRYGVLWEGWRAADMLVEEDNSSSCTGCLGVGHWLILTAVNLNSSFMVTAARPVCVTWRTFAADKSRNNSKALKLSLDLGVMPFPLCHTSSYRKMWTPWRYWCERMPGPPRTAGSPRSSWYGIEHLS